MEREIQADERGVIQIEPEYVGGIRPHDRYTVERSNGTITLRPIEGKEPFWKTATPEEWTKRFQQWVDSHTDGPGLPDEATRRESIYDHLEL